MSPKLPAVSGKQVIGALEKEGWYVKRVRGSHHVLRHPDSLMRSRYQSHGSRPVKRGTLSSILRAGGVNRDKFAQPLR